MSADAKINNAISKQLGTVVSVHHEEELRQEGTVSSTIQANLKKAKRLGKKVLFLGRGRVQLPKGYHIFSVGQLGNFPYYWEDTSNLSFNSRTYKWIISGIKIMSDSVHQNGVFINRYLQAISSVSYTLSKSDQAKLNVEYQNATNEQRLLLKAWKAAYKKLPSDASGTPPITLILSKILESWAADEMDLNKLSKASDLMDCLPNTPPKGKKILPKLKSFLNATNSSNDVLNALVGNNARLARAIQAIQSPQANNGAILTSLKKLQPAMNILTPVDDILAGLASLEPDRSVEINFEQKTDAKGNETVKFEGKELTGFSPEELLAIKADIAAEMRESGDEDLKQSPITQTKNTKSQIQLEFKGATIVEFDIPKFDEDELKNWYWIEPLKQAQEYTGKDITGFKFARSISTDFSKGGTFGYIKSVIISSLPSIRVETSHENARAVKKNIDAVTGKTITVFGQELGSVEKVDGYSAEISDDNAGLVTLRPPAQKIARPNTASRAFILGCEIVFPLAANATPT